MILEVSPLELKYPHRTRKGLLQWIVNRDQKLQGYRKMDY